MKTAKRNGRASTESPETREARASPQRRGRVGSGGKRKGKRGGAGVARSLLRGNHHGPEDLFPLPSNEPAHPGLVDYSEVLDLERQFEEGEITWPDYCVRLKELGCRD